jgi:hypothetical protein
VSDVSSKKVFHMSVAALREANGYVRSLVDSHGASQPLKAVLPAIARKIGVSERRIRAIWHGEARAISSAEMDTLRAVTRQQSSSSYADILAHGNRLEAAASALESVDPDFYRLEIDRLRDAARHVRCAADRKG